MLHDFDLISHAFPGEIVIYPIADVHLGAREHIETAWQEFLARVESEDAYLILAGDLLNNGVKTCKFVNPFDEVLRPREAKRMMVEYLTPLRDRILCVVGGNHEARTRDTDQDITYDICSKLDIEHLYRESIAFMRVSVGTRPAEPKKPEATYVFSVQHGTGGGVLTGSSVNRSERFSGALEGVDCVITGHVHKGVVTKPARIVVDARNGRITVRHTLVLSCVPWLNYGGYAARKMLLPSATACPQMLRLIADHHHKRIELTW